ncbi:ABC transporter ATP-binding protein [Gryllotalpicola protaetiae]|uniref:ABC transporter ATP-binding protein n=1 Tax=Gryllotalpicola protaetiae TaxID=2419771 RepID=A0A387BW29_9MICO|nr:ABC transporter ATP-binding protein [Gryllotalpicola protaetiae]AYG05306.1 ABC transporter ATP-binding protein [Gryllotalpicola protaetiae]
MSSEHVIEVRGLQKSYGLGAGAVRAVDGIDFTIERGEVFALLGPNGAGKSSTVEILEGYHDRSGGDVTVLGVDPQKLHGRGLLDWKARIGIVLQSNTHDNVLTVRQSLTQFASFYPNPREVDEVIAAVGLSEKADARVNKLSGGQRRRVDVALGIIGRPELLFLDEPTTGFDPEARREFWGLIRGLQAEGTSILLTTHYLDEAAQLANRVGIIAAGRLVDLGRVGEIGGPDARVPLVRWREPGAGIREQRTHQPAALVAELVARLGAEPAELEVIRPSLEDVYLQLIKKTPTELADEREGVAA